MKRYKHLVHTTTYRILRNRQEAEEATQDSFVKAYRHLGSYQGGSKFSTWLFSIAYRTAVSQLRRRKAATLDLDDPSGNEPWSWDRDMIGANDRRKALEKALHQLPPEDAAIMSFFYLEEMTIEEIVTATGLSASNVKVKLHRSRQRMLSALQEDLKDEAWTLTAD
jgi:RNA polymerase sigma-70 factor (ECF subfamily)